MLFTLRRFFKRSPTSLNFQKMAKSKYEYVRSYEIEDRLLPNCWIVVRVDGKGFHKFSARHNFQKPNDKRALDLMNKSAMTVMDEVVDIVIAYGQSDEYSFVLRKDTQIYNRRREKIMSYICSLFSFNYGRFWSEFFADESLKSSPTFDARIVLYPTDTDLRSYLKWRQVDCHINNYYNTTFWALVNQGNLTTTQAEEKLCGSFSVDKHEILRKEFGINYDEELEMFRKGTILLRRRRKGVLKATACHIDLIQEQFWLENYEKLQMDRLLLDNKGRKEQLKIDPEYLKSFELDNCLLKNSYIVIRLEKLDLKSYSSESVQKSALAVMKKLESITVSYGHNDEFSFVFHRNTNLHERDSQKIASEVTNIFITDLLRNSNNKVFSPNVQHKIALYPSDKDLKTYFMWRQSECHQKNLYKTTFDYLTKNLTEYEAKKRLEDTKISEKNEILFSEYNVNYNNEPAIKKKGIILVRKGDVILEIIDDFKDKFWATHSDSILIETQIES